MIRKPRVLFICHSPSRNGASILLLHWLRWLRREVDWDIDVLVDGPGPLVQEFRAVASTTVARDLSLFGALAPRRYRPAVQSRLRTLWAEALMLGRRYDLLYANTAAAWPFVAALRGRGHALLWHIHELGYALHLGVPRERADSLFEGSSGVIAVSEGVRETLVREYRVPSAAIDLVHGFVPAPAFIADERKQRRIEMRKQLGWPEDAFVIGGCGSLGWRKGTDLFVQIAHRICTTLGHGDVRFLWVGGGVDDRDALEFDHDIRNLDLENRCRRVQTTADVLDGYSAMDAFALTSREDPFPLVMLEASALELPLVCFAGSGGGPEFVRDDAGLIAPYLDVAAFADHLLRLKDVPELRLGFASVAAKRVRDHHSVEAQAPRLLEAIQHRVPPLRGQMSRESEGVAARLGAIGVLDRSETAGRGSRPVSSCPPVRPG